MDSKKSAHASETDPGPTQCQKSNETPALFCCVDSIIYPQISAVPELSREASLCSGRGRNSQLVKWREEGHWSVRSQKKYLYYTHIHHTYAHTHAYTYTYLYNINLHTHTHAHACSLKMIVQKLESLKLNTTENWKKLSCYLPL